MRSFSRSNPCCGVSFPKDTLLSHSQLRLFMHCGCQIIAFPGWLIQQPLFQDQIKQLPIAFTAQETSPKVPGLIYFMVFEMSPAIDSFG